MIQLTLSQAARVMQAALKNAEPETVFTGVSTDSRTVKPGMLYVPIVGQRVDGHAFAPQAVKSGAAAVLWSRDHIPYPEEFPIVLIDDPVRAMGALAREWLSHLHALVIGITGSNGKTSAKDLCASVFAQKYRTYKTQGNHNNEIGLPLTVLETDADVEVLVLEMGMENAGEITELCRIAPLDLAIITSIGSAHLENLGSIENIARAKAEMIGGLKENGVLIWNAQNRFLRKTVENAAFLPGQKAIAYGKGTKYEPQNLTFSRHGLTFALPAIRKEPFTVHAAAEVQADNATAAILAGLQEGLSVQQCADGVSKAVLTPMRGQIVEWKQALIVDDTYKSNPEAAAAALKTLMEVPGTRHVAVLGDMLDLGPEEAELHAQIGRLARKLGVDALYAFGDRSQYTVLAFGDQGFWYDDKDQLARDLAPLAQCDAVVLVKGSRAMKMETIVSALMESE